MARKVDLGDTKKPKKASMKGKPQSTGIRKRSQQEINNEDSYRKSPSRVDIAMSSSGVSLEHWCSQQLSILLGEEASDDIVQDLLSIEDAEELNSFLEDLNIVAENPQTTLFVEELQRRKKGQDVPDGAKKNERHAVKKRANIRSTTSSNHHSTWKNEGHAVKKRANIRSTTSSNHNSTWVLPTVLLLAGTVLVAIGVANDVPILDWNYLLDLITASTNPGFCNPHRNDSCDKLLQQKLLKLGDKYSEQNSNTWLTLYAAAHDHVSYQPNPQRPVVIMVYRLKNSSGVNETLEDIAGVYGSVLPPNRNYGNIVIDGKSFTNSDPEETQKQIQNMLENGFETEAQKVAIVHDFDKLPSCSVLAFHNYCNNDALHKNVAIILTITAGEEKLSPDPKAPELEKAVGKLLHEKWKDCPKELPPGKIDAMLSMVADNVILLR